MFQDFAATTSPDQGPPRIAALREAMRAASLDGFLVPRADAWQGEIVAPRDERLAWLTGFTGSAGFAAVLRDRVGLFVDGRYTLQARAQVDTDVISPVAWPGTKLGAWLKEHAGAQQRIGFDPWLHTVDEVKTLRGALDGAGITLVATDNLIDGIWTDRPAAPRGLAEAHALSLAGKAHADKRTDLAADLRQAQHDHAVLTQPDSIAWLLNIRGSDIARIPVMHGFAVLSADGRVALFADPAKTDAIVEHLGNAVARHPPEAFVDALGALTGNVRLDPKTTPQAVLDALDAGAATHAFATDPALLPKATKTDAEIAGAEAAHLRDGAAMVEFLHWLDGAIGTAMQSGTAMTETDVVRALEGFRRETGHLRDIAFDTIAGTGPHGAIVHYRVTTETDRRLADGDLLLVDSGGQYRDGTTDITRTVPVGTVGEHETACFTRVLQGMIAISRTRFPKGLAGRDLDALARAPLWRAGLDYDHGTGHGVGSYLSVHEGPQRLSRMGLETLRPGMILSNEPGYYSEGAFGIRIENLILVEEAPPVPGGDDREMLRFRTLTHVPIDRRLIVAHMLDEGDRTWLNAYHDETRRRLAPQVSESARAWLEAATAPI